MKRCPDTPPRPRERERPHRPRWRLPPQGSRPPAHRTERVPRRAWPPRARRSAALVRRVYSANTADITVRASRRLAGAARRVPPSSTVRVPPCQPCTRARARGRSRQRGAALSASSRVARRSTVLLAARLCAARRTAKRRRRRGYLCTGAEAWVPAMALASGSPAREMRARRLPEAPRRAAGHPCAARVACRPRCRDRIRRQPSATGLGR